MEKEALKETLLHGTTDFPLAVYPMLFAKKQQVLAHLHYHNEFELLVATKGCICVQTEKETCYLPEGAGIFINSGILHTILASETEPQEHGFIAIVFDYSLLCHNKDAIWSNYIQPLLHGTLEIQPLLPPSVCNAVRSLCAMYQSDTFGKELSIKESLLHIFYLLIKDAKTTKLSPQTSKSSIVKEVLDYIKQNYSEPLTLQQLAEQVHVSREYLCRVFHKLSGSSPMEYLNYYRIRQSSFLLLQSNKTVSDIALSCGFSHTSYYGKLFFRYMGCTPTSYRRNNTLIPSVPETRTAPYSALPKKQL